MYVEYIMYIPKNKYIVLVFILYSFCDIKLCVSRLSKIYFHKTVYKSTLLAQLLLSKILLWR